MYVTVENNSIKKKVYAHVSNNKAALCSLPLPPNNSNNHTLGSIRIPYLNKLCFGISEP